jgi:hypothetical protein
LGNGKYMPLPDFLETLSITVHNAQTSQGTRPLPDPAALTHMTPSIMFYKSAEWMFIEKLIQVACDNT